MRAFIAIELPPEIKEILGKLTQKLKAAEADVKWVEPKNIHLTLKFLGEIDEQIKNQVSSKMEEICQTKKPFSITIYSLGAFPNTNSPRVIWAGIKRGDNKVKEIAKTVEEHLTTIGLPQENREFSSHITLGRTRSGKNRVELAKLLLNLSQDSSTGQFIIPNRAIEMSTETEKKGADLAEKSARISKITLFKSILTPHGPIYEPIREFPLLKSTLS